MELIKNETVIKSYALALFATILTYFMGWYFNWLSDGFPIIEILAVFTSYSCTYLCVKQSRLNYPIGLISVILYSMLFYMAGLYSSMVLNIYLIFQLIYGWYRWGPDKNTRPVESLNYNSPWLFVYGVVTGVSYIALLAITNAMGASLPLLDSAILIGSILAQWLLDNKILQTWYVWIFVNIIAIYTYASVGLPLVVFQYIFFLFNAFYGWYSWKKTMERVK